MKFLVFALVLASAHAAPLSACTDLPTYFLSCSAYGGSPQTCCDGRYAEAMRSMCSHPEVEGEKCVTPNVTETSGCKSDTDCHSGGDMGGYCKSNNDCHCTAPYFASNGQTCELSCTPTSKPTACCRDDADCQSDGDKGAYCKSPKSNEHTTPGNGMCRCGTGFSGTTSCHKAAETVMDVTSEGTVCLHAEETNSTGKKCYQACAASSFKAKGFTSSGKCGVHYNTVDETHSAPQCPDGVTNIKYCQGHVVNVTFTTKGEAGHCYHNEDAADHRCYEACAYEEFKTKGFTGSGFCPDKYNVEEKVAKTRQCPDGVTNLKYCQSTAVTVTVRTLGVE